MSSLRKCHPAFFGSRTRALTSKRPHGLCQCALRRTGRRKRRGSVSFDISSPSVKHPATWCRREIGPASSWRWRLCSPRSVRRRAGLRPFASAWHTRGSSAVHTRRRSTSLPARGREAKARVADAHSPIRWLSSAITSAAISTRGRCFSGTIVRARSRPCISTKRWTFEVSLPNMRHRTSPSPSGRP
jgi:hypothetical protein